MSTSRDPDFDWRIRIRGMTEDEVAEIIEKCEAEVTTARAEVARLRDGAQKGWAANLDLSRKYDAARALLADVLETCASCRCEPAWTDRGLHAPECHFDEVDEARAFLAGSRDEACPFCGTVGPECPPTCTPGPARDLATARAEVAALRDIAMQTEQRRDQAERDLAAALAELARWKQSFGGHVYVTNERYSELVNDAERARALLAALTGAWDRMPCEPDVPRRYPIDWGRLCEVQDAVERFLARGEEKP